MKEIWKAIPNYEGGYEVSNLGRVHSIDRGVVTVSRKGTRSVRQIKGRILSPQKHSAGYAQIGLHQKIFLIHRLVLLAFIGQCPKGKESAHKNGNKWDNRLSNLSYKSPLENHNDRILHGTSGKGEKNTQAKLSDKDVLKIKRLLKTNSQRIIADKFGVHQTHISRIARGLRRK